jgi:putative transposon-encoded protein
MYYCPAVPKYLNMYSYILICMRKIAMKDGKFQLLDNIDFVYEKIVTKYGTGAKVDAPKEFLGRKVYVLIRSE